MNRVKRLPCFELRSKDDIDLFICVFMHELTDVVKYSCEIAEIQDQIKSFSGSENEDELQIKKLELEKRTLIRPHEKKLLAY